MCLFFLFVILTKEESKKLDKDNVRIRTMPQTFKDTNEVNWRKKLEVFMVNLYLIMFEERVHSYTKTKILATELPAKN